MSGGINQVLLQGTLGKDPELKYTPKGTAVATVSIATSKRVNDKDITEWHRVVVWGKAAEYVGRFQKGDRLTVINGELKTRSWEDKNSGEKKYVTEVHGFNVLCERKGDRSGRQPGDDSVNDTQSTTSDDVPF